MLFSLLAASMQAICHGNSSVMPFSRYASVSADGSPSAWIVAPRLVVVGSSVRRLFCPPIIEDSEHLCDSIEALEERSKLTSLAFFSMAYNSSVVKTAARTLSGKAEYCCREIGSYRTFKRAL